MSWRSSWSTRRLSSSQGSEDVWLRSWDLHFAAYLTVALLKKKEKHVCSFFVRSRQAAVMMSLTHPLPNQCPRQSGGPEVLPAKNCAGVSQAPKEGQLHVLDLQTSVEF